MAKVIWCGPRGLWKRDIDDIYFTQITKYIENDDGSVDRFVLSDAGEWRQYDYKIDTWTLNEIHLMELYPETVSIYNGKNL